MQLISHENNFNCLPNFDREILHKAFQNVRGGLEEIFPPSFAFSRVNRVNRERLTYITCKTFRTLKFRTFNFRTLFPSFRTIFGLR